MTRRVHVALLAIVAGIVAVVGIVIAGIYFWTYWNTAPTLDQVGGTILVYEVDAENSPPGSFEPEDLAVALRRRLDPMRRGVTVKLVDPARVEIGVPRTSPEGHATSLEEIKWLITEAGSLEFRIIANDTDDREAIAAAQQFFASARDMGVEQRRLEESARLHLPPPPPADGKTFPVRLDGNKNQHSYSWVELGRLERKTLGLSSADKEGERWREADHARTKGEPHLIAGIQGLLYSRKIVNPEALPREFDGKELEYFFLTRDPEPGGAVTGNYLTRTQATTSRGKLAVGFHFNAEGGRRFGDLTRRNRPTENVHRYLAIILDGRIESAPSLNAVITTDGVIEGEFTKEEVDRYVRVLRAGQLPAVLKPLPVSEVIVPGKGT